MTIILVEIGEIESVFLAQLVCYKLRSWHGMGLLWSPSSRLSLKLLHLVGSEFTCGLL